MLYVFLYPFIRCTSKLEKKDGKYAASIAQTRNQSDSPNIFANGWEDRIVFIQDLEKQ
jgi:hypothetical protein